MSSRYLLRFDDLCPTMDWKTWDLIESRLDTLGIRPIVAVIPDNRNTNIVLNEPKPFWPRVREWQSKGWGIALHGYQHLPHSRSAGLLGLNARSEFASLSAAAQGEMLDRGLSILRNEGIHPRIWVAPYHSFDETTLRLLAERDITIVSDGFGSWPYRRHGHLWIPQQLSRFEPRRNGIWTVCIHHNKFAPGEFEGFCRDVEQYAGAMTDALTVANDYPFGRTDLPALAHRWTMSVSVRSHARLRRVRDGMRGWMPAFR